VSLAPELRARFDAIAARYPGEMRPSLVLPLLHCMQQAQGHVTRADAVVVAEYAGVPAMQAVEALEWYSMFEQAPQGRHVIKVCRNIACSLRGAEALTDLLRGRLGIEVGTTTPDGRFTLRTVECLASCGTAPVMQVNEVYHERLHPARVEEILESLA
jgi:NADH-quinone oxidoreductase subunit E